MKRKRFIFSGVIVFILLLILFTICIEYKIEENRLKQTVDSGEVVIYNKKIKLPISIHDFEKKFGKVEFKSESYDGDVFFYYDGKTGKSNSIKPSARIEGTLTLKDETTAVFIINNTNKNEKVSDSYIIGVRLNNDTKLFKDISLNTTKQELTKLLYTGKLNPFQKDYNGSVAYNNTYTLEVMYHDNEIDDIVYYLDYEKCKEDNCSKYMK